MALRKPSVALATALFLSLSGAARAAEVDTAPTSALGGAGVANAMDNGALRRCPATLPLVEAYNARGDVGPVSGGFDAGWRLSASLRDSRTSILSAGVMYTRERLKDSSDTTELPGWKLPDEALADQITTDTWRAGGGYGLLNRRLGIGVGVAWDRQTSLYSDSWDNHVGVDASLAGRVDPQGVLMLAATVHDLGPWALRDPSAEIGAWIRATEQLGIAVDGLWDGQNPGGRLGIRGSVMETLLLGVGGGWTGTTAEIGAGIGITDQQYSLEYALRADLLAEADPLAHTIGVSLAF